LDYWRGFSYLLEAAGLRVQLVNATHGAMAGDPQAEGRRVLMTPVSPLEGDQSRTQQCHQRPEEVQESAA
jgi:hypothetical protein